jgi:hypothetical protein
LTGLGWKLFSSWERLMQERLLHGCDERRIEATGMEHADSGITSTKWGSPPLELSKFEPLQTGEPDT